EGSGGSDAVLLEIDPTTGNVLSKTLFGGAQDDKANGVATDGTDLYVVGESRSFANGGNSVGQNDVMLLRYTLAATPPTNQRPVADAGGPYTINEGDSLTLDASSSTDPDGDPLSYSWDVNGDGIYGDATGVSPTLTWSQLNA